MAENFNHNGNEPDQQFNHENTDSNNLYAKQYTKEQEQLAQLEESAPQLTAPIDRGLNKKALAFIILAGFGLTGLGAFAYHQLSGTEEAPPPARAEVVTVPDLPHLNLLNHNRRYLFLPHPIQQHKIRRKISNCLLCRQQRSLTL